jgi:4'-phosphopantetheinyl transferase EntD
VMAGDTGALSVDDVSDGEVMVSGRIARKTPSVMGKGAAPLSDGRTIRTNGAYARDARGINAFMSSDEPNDASVLIDALSSMAGPDCVCAAAPAEVVDAQLFPQEREHVARAIAKRQAEFGTARVLARRALSTLGYPPLPLVPHADRSPSWPAQVVGSISHSHGHCAVVVASARHFAGVGLDLETSRTLRANMQAAICTPDEQQWVQQQRASAGDALWLDLLVFSAKESFYKCQYPLTRTFLGFHDVGLQFDLQLRSFRATMLSERVPQRERLLQIHGQWRQLPDALITLATLRPN